MALKRHVKPHLRLWILLEMWRTSNVAMVTSFSKIRSWIEWRITARTCSTRTGFSLISIDKINWSIIDSLNNIVLLWVKCYATKCANFNVKTMPRHRDIHSRNDLALNSRALHSTTIRASRFLVTGTDDSFSGGDSIAVNYGTIEKESLQ